MGNIESDDIIATSLCNKCERLMIRVVTPLDLESMGIDEEMLSEFDIPEGDTLEIVYLTCLEDHNTMDYIVKECNRFKPRRRKSLLSNEDSFI